MKIILLWLPYIFFGYFSALIFKMYRMSNGTDIWTKLLFVCSNMEIMIKHPFQKLLLEDVLAGTIATLFLYLIVQYRIRHYSQGF